MNFLCFELPLEFIQGILVSGRKDKNHMRLTFLPTKIAKRVAKPCRCFLRITLVPKNMLDINLN